MVRTQVTNRSNTQKEKEKEEEGKMINKWWQQPISNQSKNKNEKEVKKENVEQKQNKKINDRVMMICFLSFPL